MTKRSKWIAEHILMPFLLLITALYLKDWLDKDVVENQKTNNVIELVKIRSTSEDPDVKRWVERMLRNQDLAVSKNDEDPVMSQALEKCLYEDGSSSFPDDFVSYNWQIAAFKNLNNVHCYKGIMSYYINPLNKEKILSEISEMRSAIDVDLKELCIEDFNYSEDPDNCLTDNLWLNLDIFN